MGETERDDARIRDTALGETKRETAKLLALIVDDDEDFRSSVAALVRREGFDTILAGSLEEARKSLTQTAPDLAIVDLQLPDGHGLELMNETLPASDTEFVVDHRA